MANVNILNLEVAIGLTGEEWFPVVQSGTTKRAQTSQVMVDDDVDNMFASIADAEAYTPPGAPPDFIVLAGYAAAGDGGAALYKKVNAQPSHLGRFQIVGGTWYEITNAILRPEQFGGFPDESADCATAANSALGVLADRGGGRLEFVGAGIYLLFSTGAHSTPWAGHVRCIEIPDSNIEIYIGPSATLKLADGEVFDGGDFVDIITWGADKSNLSIEGPGLITGNTAGQTGWTGGYSQGSNGDIIVSRGGGDTNIYIGGGLRLEDYFACAVNLGANAVARLSNITFHDLHATNCGEGQQVITADSSRWIDCTYTDTTGVTVGDALEASGCRFVYSDGCRVTATADNPVSAGSAWDLFGSRQCIVTGMLVDGWPAGMDGSTPAGSTCTITIASPAVVTEAAHGLQAGDAVFFTTTGTLPTGITSGTVYYVMATGLTADAFQIAASEGGAAINTSGTQSGTQTLRIPTDRVLVSNSEFNNMTDTVGLGIMDGRVTYSNCKINGGPLVQFAQLNGDQTGKPPVYFYNCTGDGCRSLLYAGSNRKIVWDGGGLKNSVDGAAISLSMTASSGSPKLLDLSNLVFENNGIDISLNDDGSHDMVITGAISDCRLLSTTPFQSRAGSRNHDISGWRIGTNIITTNTLQSDRALADNALDAPATGRNIHTGGIPAQASTDGNDTTPSTTEFYFAEILVPQPATATGVSVFWGSASSGNAKVGLANAVGAVIATSASTAQSGTDAYQRIAFTAAEALVPGVYYILLFMDNNTVRFNTHTFGDFGAGKSTGQTYATGFTTITPPTTFTANVGPFASLY